MMMTKIRSEATKHNDNLRMRKHYDYGQAVLKRYKVRKGCAKCGYNKNAQALQFNHINPEDKCFLIGQKIHKMYLGRHTKGKIAVKAEIAKCEVLCANCHCIHTFEEEHFAAKRKGR
jgi:hypothetical protein